MGEDFIFGETNYSDTVVKRRQRELRTVWHNHRMEPRDPLPGQAVTLTVDVGPSQRADRVFCYWTTAPEQPAGHAGIPSCGQVIELEKVGLIWDDLVWDYVERWQGVLPPQLDGTYVRYRLEAWDARRRVGAFADHGDSDPLLGPPFAYHVDFWQPPDWIRDAIIYQVMLDRFNPGSGRRWKEPAEMNGVFGGTLPGMVEKLPYISKLGFNTLWVSPILESPSSHHYDATNHRAVSPDFGTNQDFRELVEAAHREGLRVLLDFVVHATSDRHPFMVSARADRNSPYFSYYTFTQWPDHYDCFFGVKDLPHLNLEYVPARRYILDSALFWLDFGVDGFRLDYVIQPSCDFWVELQSTVRQARPDFCTLGEAVIGPAGLRTFEGKLDGCLDFTLASLIRSTFIFGEHDLAFFNRFLDQHESYQPGTFIRPSFIDSHDMNRVMFIARGDVRKVKLAAVCQFSLSQPPVMLYGTEVGLSQKGDGRNNLDMARDPMPWDSAPVPGLTDFYRRLCHVRSAHPCLSRGLRRTLFADAASLAYSKEDDKDACLVVLNLGDARRLSIPSEGLPQRLVDVFTGESFPASNNAFLLDLQPMQAAILVPG
jgi:cyclomaltodextrinase / maltogenic alpha-amylase / neopullulanase